MNLYNYSIIINKTYSGFFNLNFWIADGENVAVIKLHLSKTIDIHSSLGLLLVGHFKNY